MLYAIIVLFALAAIAGLVILKNWLTNQNTSRALVYSHGLLAAVALVLLLIYYINNSVKSLEISLILFVLAALIGFYLFFRDLKGKMSSNWIAFIHALVAVVGFAFLILMII